MYTAQEILNAVLSGSAVRTVRSAQEAFNLVYSPTSAALRVCGDIGTGSGGGDDISAVSARVFDLEEAYEGPCIWYASVSQTSGSISGDLPTSAELLLDRWPDGLDALVTQLDASARVSWEDSLTAGGSAIAATLDASGNFELTGSPSAGWPLGLVYAYRVKRKNFDQAKVVFEAGIGGGSGTTGSGLTTADVIGTANRVMVTDNGNGTITISGPQNLHTSADIVFQRVRLQDGSNATPALTFRDDTDTGFYRTSSGLAVAVGGVKQLEIIDATQPSKFLKTGIVNQVYAVDIQAGDIPSHNHAGYASATAYANHAASASIHFAEGSIHHTDIQGVGTNSHVDIDTHISSGAIHFTQGSISHTALADIGSNNHGQIDSHLGSASIHFGISGISHLDIQNIGANSHSQIDAHLASASVHFAKTSADAWYAPLAKGVTSGDSHDHSGGDGAQIDHGGLTGLADDDHGHYLTSGRSDLLYYRKGSAATAVDLTAHTSSAAIHFAISGTPAVGDIAYWNGSTWTRLAKDAGKYLKSGDAPAWDTPSGAGVTDHGALTGLTDDDHAQYLTSARSDVFYYRKTSAATAGHTHAQLHDRSHAMTGASDHTATAWRVFYAGSGGAVTELALGASGTYLKSNGAAAAPSFATPAAGGGATTGLIIALG